MIYCNLKGGLGNMLFQIAAAKSYSLIKNTECSFPNLYNHLNTLNSYYKIEHCREYNDFLKLNIKNPIDKLSIYSYPFEYNSIIPDENEYYIDGFFQSEKYFKNHKNEILEFIKPSLDINNIIKSKYSHILARPSISVHVRRGDYLKFSNIHPSQEIKYYEECFAVISNKTNINNAVIFSDDVSWCKDNLKFNNSIFIENEKDYIELFLMSKCQHNIISNSSFSWWGAWLNQNPNKLIACPKKWFGTGISNVPSNDICPDEWIKV